ncbi:MAG: hypothetical protein JNK23_16395 [Opitutaceae bacterium]|nr:hypothetical protein [Opitutaceae bacterium]
MKTTNKLILALGLLTSATAIQAQTTTTASTPAGLLGAQYTELEFGVQDIKRISNNAYSLTASANTAVVAGKLDGGASYSYSRIGGAVRGHSNTIGGYFTAYAPLNGVKPFVSAGLGWEWSSYRFVGSDDQALWGGAVGVEIPAGVVTITPRISYADDFEGSRKSSQAWTYAVEANHWFNKSTAVFASIGKSDVTRSPIDSWNYSIGLRARF